jgi:hypothetical protein
VNYIRIYDEFIKDRRRKEPGLTGYTERHHIVPRSLGGTDAKTNIIRLTAEDHFFAHLLLAKIHGGKLWAPIAFMVNGTRKDYKPVQSRKAYAWASRAMAHARSGRNAEQFSHVMHELKHQDGRVWCGVQFDMSELGLSRSLANMLVKGRIKSARGWFLAKHHKHEVGRKGGTLHPMYRSEVHKFHHVDGRTFEGTQFDFHLQCGVSKSAACTLVRGKVSTANGWFLDGKQINPRGKSARWLKKRA